MCGRFAYQDSKDELAARFDAADPAGVPDLAPSYNVPPSRPATVVGYHPAKRRRGLAVMSWGLVPRWWSRPLKDARRPANATAEAIRTTPTFRDSFRLRRCLVPVAGFYEWKKDDGPYFVRPANGGVLALAGVWDRWAAPGGDPLFTFAVVTTTANAVMAPIHHRMPAVLPPDTWAAWLDPATPAGEAAGLLGPCPAAALSAYRVSPRVNSSRNDGPDLIAPAA